MPSPEQIAKYLEAGRPERVLTYIALVAGGLAAFFWPSTVLPEQSSSLIAKACMVIWIGCSVTCLWGAVRRTWAQEYIFLPFLCLALDVFAGALAAQAIPYIGSGETTPSTLSYACFFFGFASLLMSRHAKVRVIYRADAERGTQ